MDGFIYTLTLEEPVLANSLGGEPNSANSLYYIPGGAIRGAAILAYGPDQDAAEGEFKRLFLNGETRFLNAYPLMNRKRALPAPLTWQVERKPAPDAEKKVYKDLSAVPLKEDTQEKYEKCALYILATGGSSPPQRGRKMADQYSHPARCSPRSRHKRSRRSLSLYSPACRNATARDCAC